MAISAKATILGDKAWLRKLKKLAPENSREILVRSLLECADLVVENAKREQIIRGGRFFAKGPRGGKTLTDAPVHPKRLTSRTGTLRDSISSRWQNQPVAIEVGTELEYGRVHEVTGAGKARIKRPFLKPAVEAVEDRFPQVFMYHWRRVAGE